jgi:diguanylate cyclase (GGDEF)-like protein
LRKSLRRHDLGFRWGGEEFLILLWDTTLEQAVEFSNRIRLEVARDPTLGITISVGVSGGKPSSVGELESWIAQADQALYQAKKAGRNQVRVRHYLSN